MKLVVGDSSSLILLAKADILSDLLNYVEIIIPTIVFNEIMVGKIKNKQDAYYIEKLILDYKIKIENPNEKLVSQIKFLYKLDEGELYAIALAKERSLNLLIDDKSKNIVDCSSIFKSFVGTSIFKYPSKFIWVGFDIKLSTSIKPMHTHSLD